MHAQGRYYCTTRTYVRTPGAFWSVDLDIYIFIARCHGNGPIYMDL